eukprot:1149337-Pelagomonas_calceolata.AAC.4
MGLDKSSHLLAEHLPVCEMQPGHVHTFPSTSCERGARPRLPLTASTTTHKKGSQLRLSTGCCARPSSPSCEC